MIFYGVHFLKLMTMTDIIIFSSDGVLTIFR